MSFQTTVRVDTRSTHTVRLISKDGVERKPDVEFVEFDLGNMTAETVLSLLSIGGVGEVKDLEPLLPIHLSPEWVSKMLKRIPHNPSHAEAWTRSRMTDPLIRKHGLTIS